MRLASAALVTAVALCGRCHGCETAESQSVVALEKLGARFMRNAKGHITTVILIGPQVRDDHMRIIARISTVHAVQLIFTNTSGTGLSHLSVLPDLTGLYLGGTRFSPRQMNSILKLRNLKSITIVNVDSMTGASEFLNLQQRRTFAQHKISDNQLSLLAKLPELRGLEIRGMPIDGSAFKAFLHTKHLRQLGLADSSISDAGLRYIGKVQSLHELDLERTRVTGKGILHLTDLAQLNFLNVFGTSVTGAGVRSLRTMKSLRNLNVDRRINERTIGELQSTFPFVSISQTDSVRNLLRAAKGRSTVSYRYACAVSFLESIGVTISMRSGRADVLDLSMLRKLESPRIDSVVQFVGDLRDVKQIKLSTTTLTDRGLRCLRQLSELDLLDLGGTRVTDQGLVVLQKFKKLRAVGLTATRVTDTSLVTLSRIPTIKELYLGMTNVTDAGLARLALLPKLEKLSLQGCAKISDRALDGLKRFKSLKSIDLRGTSVTAEGIKRLRKLLPKLQVRWSSEI